MFFSRNIKLMILALIFLVLIPINAFAGRLSGKLVTNDSPDNYKILAIAKNTKTNSATVNSLGRFKIKARKNSTLQIIKTTGEYVGPIVWGQNAKAYTKVNGLTGKLGKVRLKDAGFATVPTKEALTTYIKKNPIDFDNTMGPNGAGNLSL